MERKLFFLTLIFILSSLGLMAQTTIPGDSLVYGPMFSPMYNNSVRAWVLTKSNTGTGDVLSLSVTSAGAPSTEISGNVYNSDDRLGYSLRSYEFTGLTPGESYAAKVLVDGAASTRISTIKNENEIIDDFEFLSGGCARIYDLTRCIDQPESAFHKNGTPEMFNVMAQEESDMMVWLGDAVYLLGLQHADGQCPDGVDDWANKDMAFDRYRFQRDFQDSLTVAMPQLAITDNHDLGPNEFDKNLPTIGDMREIFMDWWPNPEYNTTSEGQGLFSSYVYKDVEYFLTDNRSFRDGTSQHFGPEQLEWLKQGLLNSTATFKVIVNGTPTFTEVGGRNFSVSTQAPEFLAFIQNNNINGVLSLSADIHEQRFMVRDGDTNYPLYDILSGNLNSDVGNGNFNINYNSNNLIQGVKQTYLRINVYGEIDDRRMKVEYVGADGQPYFEGIIHEDMLTSQNEDAYKLGLNFSNAITDASAYGHTANATNLTYGTDRIDAANEAAVFGTTTALEIPTADALTFHDRPFSAAFWVNPTTLSENGGTILSNGADGAGVSFGISQLGKLTYTDHAQGTTLESDYKLLPNSWSYVTWKYDNVKRKLALYYNGFLIQDWTNVVSPLPSDAVIQVGNNFEGKRFLGILDDLSLYGRLISDADILTDANIQTNRGGVLNINANPQMAIPGQVINPIFEDDFTIEFWGKLNSDPGTNNKILSSNGRIDGNTAGLSLEFPSSNKLNLVVGTNTGGWETISDAGDVWNVGEWNHIALVFSTTNNTVDYYQNSKLIGSGPFAGYIPNDWGLGFGYSPFYNGAVSTELDEVRIWQRSLTAEEITASMHYPLLGDEAGLAMYYDFTPETDTDTSVVSAGSVNYEIALDGGELITATSPIGNISVEYQEKVAGKWSKNNDFNNSGLTFPEAVTAYNSNIVVGKKSDTAMEEVPGLDNVYYANGGWKMDPLNSPFATVKINLAETLNTASDSISSVAGQYYLLRQDEENNEFSIVTDGAFDGSSVTFYDANLEEGLYYLAWEEGEFVVGRGGALSLAGGHDVHIPSASVEPIFEGNFTLEFWVDVTEDPAANDKLMSNNGRIDGNSTGITVEMPDNNSVSAVFGTNAGAWNAINSGDAVVVGEWNHIAITAAPGDEIKLYVNGALKASSPYEAYAPNATWDFALGESINYGGETKSVMDEFRIFARVKTEEEIVAQMHQTLEEDSELVFNYTFNQEDDGVLVNAGTNTDIVNYISAQIISATSPVSEIPEEFSDIISGNWSIQNGSENGLYLTEPVESFTQNTIVGRDENNEILPLGTVEDTFYLVGGWFVNALNMEVASLDVALSNVFENAAFVDATVTKYMLLKGDPASDYEIVSTATATNGVLTFADVSLGLGNYYLAYEADTAAAIADQGGAINLTEGHEVNIPKEGVNQALSEAFTVELWGRLDAPAGGNTKQEELTLKLIIKRYGTEDEKADALKLRDTAQAELDNLETAIEKSIVYFKKNLTNTDTYEHIKKSVNALEKQLKKDKSNPEKLRQVTAAKTEFKGITRQYNKTLKNIEILEAKVNSIDKLLNIIGGQITDAESQKLILKKHFDLINDQLQRYLSREIRILVAAYQNLWDKYAVSAQSLEEKREKTMSDLNQFLTALNYLD